MKDHDDKSALSLEGLRKIEVDVDRYQAMLDDPSLTDKQKEQIITALWQIIIAFVDLGFGVHPAQQACGKAPESIDGATADSPDAVDLRTTQ